MLTTGIRDNNNNYPISDSSYNIVQFVSGIKEFLVSGRIDNLKEFFKGSQENQDNPSNGEENTTPQQETPAVPEDQGDGQENNEGYNETTEG
jgi:hypothetical protein